VERKLVSIRRIDQVWKHPGADRLDIVMIGGWQCVSQTGTFHVGDLGLFHEIDSFLPLTHPAYADMAKGAVKWTDLTGTPREGYRVKTMKLRGEWSQGYLLPLKEFPELVGQDLTPEAQDFAELLGVLKREKIIPMGGTAKGSFPSFIRKAEQERVQGLWNKFGPKGGSYVNIYTNAAGEEIRVEKPYELHRDTDYEVTVKLDGSSMTVFSRDDEFGVCSRNNELVEAEGNAFWAVAHELKLRERLTALGRNLSLQGELCGPGIQDNRDKLPKLDFYVFDIFDIDKHKYLSQNERIAVLRDIGAPYIKQVPFVEIRQFDFATMEDLEKYAEGPSLNKDVKREGVVFKSIENPDVSFKVISRSYLVKHDA
jgi:RNA ligase (TIGR02306 family)